jgi:hypothetical protein
MQFPSLYPVPETETAGKVIPFVNKEEHMKTEDFEWLSELREERDAAIVNCCNVR